MHRKCEARGMSGLVSIWIQELDPETVSKVLTEKLGQELTSDWLPRLAVSSEKDGDKLRVAIDLYDRVLEPSQYCAESVAQGYWEEGIDPEEAPEDEFQARFDECMRELLSEVNPPELDDYFKIADIEVAVYTYQAETDYDDYGYNFAFKIPLKYYRTIWDVADIIMHTVKLVLTITV